MSEIITPRPIGEYSRIRVPNIEIVGPRLLVMPKPRREEVTDSGIVVPEFAQENSQEGVVILVGDGVMLPDGTKVPPRVEQGDAIIYARYAGVELEMDEQQFIIINESDVRAVLTYKGKVFRLDDE